jgi:hypothetical protein
VRRTRLDPPATSRCSPTRCMCNDAISEVVRPPPRKSRRFSSGDAAALNARSWTVLTASSMSRHAFASGQNLLDSRASVKDHRRLSLGVRGALRFPWAASADEWRRRPGGCGALALARPVASARRRPARPATRRWPAASASDERDESNGRLERDRPVHGIAEARRVVASGIEIRPP